MAAKTKRSPKMTSAKRSKMKSSTFGLAGKRKYPLDTKGRAKNALARVAQHGTKAEQKAVRAKAVKRYPSLAKKT